MAKLTDQTDLYRLASPGAEVVPGLSLTVVDGPDRGATHAIAGPLADAAGYTRVPGERVYGLLLA